VLMPKCAFVPSRAEEGDKETPQLVGMSRLVPVPVPMPQIRDAIVVWQLWQCGYVSRCLCFHVPCSRESKSPPSSPERAEQETPARTGGSGWSDCKGSRQYPIRNPEFQGPAGSNACRLWLIAIPPPSHAVAAVSTSGPQSPSRKSEKQAVTKRALSEMRGSS
jgi:hypothetical protein